MQKFQALSQIDLTPFIYMANRGKSHKLSEPDFIICRIGKLRLTFWIVMTVIYLKHLTRAWDTVDALLI